MNVADEPRLPHKGWRLATQLIIVMTATLLIVQLINISAVLWLPPPRPGALVSVASVVEGLATLKAKGVGASSEDQARLAREASTDDMRFAVAHAALSTPQEPAPSPLTTLAARIAVRLSLNPDDVRVAVEGPLSSPAFVNPGARGGRRAETVEDMMMFPSMVIALRTEGDTWVEGRLDSGPEVNLWIMRIVSWFAVGALVLVPASLLFAHRLARPIRQFAVAAEQLGRDPNAPRLEEDGPKELRIATRAFNDMRQRLQRFVEDRTHMLAAISHDLRTPIQRLRFRIDSVPEAERARFSTDLDEIESMIGATLAFARDASAPSKRELIDLTALVETICADAADAGQPVSCACEDHRLIVKADLAALRRVISNLVENAVKYGSIAKVLVFVTGERAVVEISDDGPGVPEDKLEEVFQPFRRLEESRSRETGGVGLGLSIARSIARAHGGDVILKNQPHGGLLARLELPL